MSIRKRNRKPKVLSSTMTVGDLEEWFEAEFEKERRRIARKPKANSSPKILIEEAKTNG